MNLKAIAIAALAVLGCRAITPPAQTLTADDLVGSWQLTPSAGSSCAGLTSPPTLYFSIPAGAIDESGAFAVTTTWDVTPGIRFDDDWWLVGSVNVKTFDVRFDFWRSFEEIGSVFTGTIDPATGIVAGTLLDPKPGFASHFATGSCSLSLAGARVGP